MFWKTRIVNRSNAPRALKWMTLLKADYYCEALRTVLSMTHQPKIHDLVESVLIKGEAR